MAFLDPATREVVSLPLHKRGEARPRCRLAGPLPSTGLGDSLDHDGGGAPELPDAWRAGCDPLDYATVTDHATLMTFEQRDLPQPIPTHHAVFLDRGDYGIFDLGEIRVGFPQLTVDTPCDAVLDIGYSQVFFEDRRIRFSNGGRRKNVDRLYLPGGTHEWEPMQRRTGRYVHVSCRKGRQILLSAVRVQSVGYPVEDIGTFESADESLNEI